jgi:hypothetical protein
MMVMKQQHSKQQLMEQLQQCKLLSLRILKQLMMVLGRQLVMTNSLGLG